MTEVTQETIKTSIRAIEYRLSRTLAEIKKYNQKGLSHNRLNFLRKEKELLENALKELRELI